MAPGLQKVRICLVFSENDSKQGNSIMSEQPNLNQTNEVRANEGQINKFSDIPVISFCRTP